MSQEDSYSVRMECTDILEICNNHFEMYGINNRGYYSLFTYKTFMRDEMSMMLYE